MPGSGVGECCWGIYLAVELQNAAQVFTSVALPWSPAGRRQAELAASQPFLQVMPCSFFQVGAAFPKVLRHFYLQIGAEFVGGFSPKHW